MTSKANKKKIVSVLSKDELIASTKDQIKEKDKLIEAMEKRGKESLLADMESVMSAMKTAEGIRAVLNSDIMKQLTIDTAAGIAKNVCDRINDTIVVARETDDTDKLPDVCESAHLYKDKYIFDNEPDYNMFVEELVCLDLCRRFGKQAIDIASGVARSKDERKVLQDKLIELEMPTDNG